MHEVTLEEVNTAVGELRAEVKSSRPDKEKQERIDGLLDTYEEKVVQPLILAQEEAKNLKEDYAALEEKMVEAGATASEAKERCESLELELANRTAHQNSEDPEAYRLSDEYKALRRWVEVGDRDVTPEEKVLLRTDINADGGYLVPTEMDSMIVKKITEIDPIRPISRVRTIAGKSINLPVRTSIPTAVYESEAETGTDSASAYINEMVTPFRQTFTTPITIDLLQDSAFNMDAEIMGDAAEAFAFGEGEGFVTGSGVKEPEGFTTNAALRTAARATGASGAITVENLIDLSSDLKVGYDPVFVFNRRTLAIIRKFRADAVSAADSAGNFLWSPALDGPVSQNLLGFRYILANSMPDVGANAFAVAFGDFRRGYTIVDRTGLAVIRDDVTQKRKATVEFTLHRWNTAQVTLTEPIKLLKCDA